MGNIEWMPIEDLPDEMKDGRPLLIFYLGRMHVASWQPIWHPSNMKWVVFQPATSLADHSRVVNDLGPDYDADGKLSAWSRPGPTHWAEINPPPADPGIPVHPAALVEKGIPGLATIPERPAQCPICGELYAPSNAQDAAFHSGMHYRPATDDVLGKDGE